MSLEKQRAMVIAHYQKLVLQREAINKEITKTLDDFFIGKEVVIKHSRGEFEAKVRKMYSDGTLAVENLGTGLKSTRHLFDLKCMIETSADVASIATTTSSGLLTPSRMGEDSPALRKTVAALYEHQQRESDHDLTDSAAPTA